MSLNDTPSLKPPRVWFHFVTNETGAQTNIRKWSHAPFEGAVEYVLARTPAPASADAMEVGREAVRVLAAALINEEGELAAEQAAARIIQQYGDQREAAGFRRAVEAAAKAFAAEITTWSTSMKRGHDAILALLETQEAK